MAKSPDPAEILQRAFEEGERRLDQSMLELVSTGFIAGLTIVFGIAALAVVHALLEPQFGELAELGGALAFGVGVVFLIVGRAELFTENFFDPVATVVMRRRSGWLRRLLRLWGVTLVLNLVGGGLFGLVIAFDGVLTTAAGDVLRRIAEDTVARDFWAGFLKAVVGGTLITLMSFLIRAVNSVGNRMVVAYIVGFLLTAGVFAHAVVTTLYVFIGMLLGAEVGLAELATTALIATVGNMIGGLGLVTLTHIARAESARESDSC